MIIRAFYDIDFFEEQEITLNEEESRYLKILRIKNGEKIEVFGKNYYADAEITGCYKNCYTALIKTIKQFNKIFPKIILIQAMPELKKAEIITQKSVELGIDEIYFFETCRSEKVKANLIAKFEKIAREAIRQSKRRSMIKLKVSAEFPLKSLFEQTKQSKKKVFCLHPQTEKNFTFEALINYKGFDYIFIIIGPESGFDESDMQLFSNVAPELSIIKISENILRTETAAISGCAIFSLLKLQQ